MAGCTEVKEKKYQTRKSPPYHAGDCRGQTKKGGDKALWKSEANGRGVYRWVKVATRKEKEKKGPKGKMYKIHDNGGTPFKVFVDKDRVSVYRMDYKLDTDTSIMGKEVFSTTAKKIYLGEDHMHIGYEPMSAGNKGNSILLKESATKYIFIGWKIQSFQPIKGDEIIGYESPIGNNDVPYPFAIGKDYTYLLIEEKVIPNSALDMKKDPYEQYYGFGGKYPEVKKAAKKLPMKVLVKRA